MSQLLQKIFITVGAAGLLFLGYVLFVQPSQFALDDSAVNPLADSVLAKTQIFIERRAQLDQVSIDSALFTDPRFTSLRSYTSALSNQSVGKSSLFELPPSLANTQVSDE
ncbi:MAG: hypothetical protein MUF19_03550 [Candidatus Pacebacteria bacterium]|jgi:hypothetical protein|nr:hypothetical protein [Candidatus Paceibacterota bacterium]